MWFLPIWVRWGLTSKRQSWDAIKDLSWPSSKHLPLKGQTPRGKHFSLRKTFSSVLPAARLSPAGFLKSDPAIRIWVWLMKSMWGKPSKWRGKQKKQREEVKTLSLTTPRNESRKQINSLFVLEAQVSPVAWKWPWKRRHRYKPLKAEAPRRLEKGWEWRQRCEQKRHWECTGPLSSVAFSSGLRDRRGWNHSPKSVNILSPQEVRVSAVQTIIKSPKVIIVCKCQDFAQVEYMVYCWTYVCWGWKDRD